MTKEAKELSLRSEKAKGHLVKKRQGEGVDLKKATGGHQSVGSLIQKRITSNERMKVSNTVTTPPMRGDQFNH